MVWDEENRLCAIKAMGNVSHYIYDAGGERTLKLKSSSLTININGISAGASEVDDQFTIYPNAYSVVRKDQYTKHFFLGSQRILSKISSNNVSSTFYEGNANQVGDVNYDELQTELEEQINVNTELLNVGWYRNSRGQVPNEHIKHYLLSSEHGGLSGQNPFETGDTTETNPEYEYKQYFFHPDHLGSSNYLTDITGETYQHVEYLPFGEVFFEERNTQQDRNTYLYNGKELDEETGLYYYGARFYDAQIGRWHSVDPLAEKYYSMSPYNYVTNNPINVIDPNGMFSYYLNGEYIGERGEENNEKRETPPDDYWTKDGKFLGTINATREDGKPSDEIRIMSQKTWDKLQAKGETNNDEYVNRSENINTVMGVADNVWLSIIDYYMNKTDYIGCLPFTPFMKTKISKENSLTTGSNNGVIEYTVQMASDFPNYFSGDMGFTVSNVQNAMGHEWRHAYQRLTGDRSSIYQVNEFDAMKFQMQLNSWENTTTSFKISIFKYFMKNFKEYLNK